VAEHGNEKLARRFYEEEQFPKGWPPGREGFKRLVTTWRSAQPGALPPDLSQVAGPRLGRPA
jgi:hypothetical protein